MCIQHETKQNNATPSHVRTKLVYHCAWACVPFIALLLINYTWMGIRIRGRCSRGTKLRFALFFFSKHFQNFENPFVHCAHVRAVFCHLHVPPLTPTHQTNTRKSWTVLLIFDIGKRFFFTLTSVYDTFYTRDKNMKCDRWSIRKNK